MGCHFFVVVEGWVKTLWPVLTSFFRTGGLCVLERLPAIRFFVAFVSAYSLFGVEPFAGMVSGTVSPLFSCGVSFVSGWNSNNIC